MQQQWLAVKIFDESSVNKKYLNLQICMFFFQLGMNILAYFIHNYKVQEFKIIRNMLSFDFLSIRTRHILISQVKAIENLNVFNLLKELILLI